MPRLSIRVALIAFLFCAAGISDVFARGGTVSEQSRCTADASRLCRKYIPDGDFAVLDCLKKNRRIISSGCRKVLRDNGQL